MFLKILKTSCVKNRRSLFFCVVELEKLLSLVDGRYVVFCIIHLEYMGLGAVPEDKLLEVNKML